MSLRLKALYAGARFYWWLFKPVTFGVKVMLIRDETVLLVKHSYEGGWHLPGGGVKRGETVTTAVHREAREELGVTLNAVSLFGVYSNLKQSRSDHIVVFLCLDFFMSGRKDDEIEAYRFFSFDRLPLESTSGTENRIAEYVGEGERPLVGEW